MGGDGGTKAVNRKYLRGSKGNESAAAEKVDENERTLDRVSTCTISGKELTEPIVCDKVGNLYNKEAIYMRLLEKSLDEDEYRHIRRTKNLINCKMTPNPAFEPGKDRSETGAKFICPVTMIEMNGKYPFVILEKSGKVLSLKAVKEVKGVADGERYLQLFPSAEVAKQRQEEILNKKKSKSGKNKSKREADGELPVAKKNKKKSEINSTISAKAKMVIAAAEEKVEASKEGSATYKKLFATEEEDLTKDGEDKNRLFMIGNPRGYVRC